MEFRISAVAVAIDPHGASKLATSMRDWLVRGIVQYGTGDQAPVKAGAPALVGRHTALRLGLMADLVSLGLPAADAADAADAREAARIAASWSHFGRPDRLPGGLYAGKDTMTLLGVWRSATGELRHRILPASHRVTLGHLRWEFGGQTKVTGPLLIVDLGDVLDRLEPLFLTASPAADK